MDIKQLTLRHKVRPTTRPDNPQHLHDVLAIDGIRRVVHIAPSGGGRVMIVPFDAFQRDFVVAEAQAHLYHKARFDIDGGPRVIGYTTGRRWNGWAMPAFAYDTAVTIFSEHYTGWKWFYNESDDTFHYWIPDDSDATPYEAKGFTITVDGEPLRVYAIGDGWCWDESPIIAGQDRELAVQAARIFSRLLHDYLGDEAMARIVRANAAEEDPNICHTHDELDANVVMAEALQQCGFDIDIQNERHAAIFNAAWDLAKAAGFDPDRI